MAVERTFAVMGTRAHLVVEAPPHTATRLLDVAVERLALMERRWSRFLPTSELSQLNAAAGKPTIVSSDTFSVIQSAIDAWRLTAGAFDPTIGAAVRALGYDRSFAELAEPVAAPDQPRPAPGCAGIELDPGLNAVRLPVDVQLDLGGIGKGAAADLVVAQLLEMGADGACVNVGGNVRVEGRAPTSAGWIVGLLPSPHLPPRRVALRSGAVCTSTRTKRTWTTDSGARRHHLVDPRTGRPTSGVQSVSVIGARAMQAEVLTKVIFVDGVAAGRHLVDENDCCAVIVGDDGVTTEIGSLEEIAA